MSGLKMLKKRKSGLKKLSKKKTNIKHKQTKVRGKKSERDALEERINRTQPLDGLNRKG